MSKKENFDERKATAPSLDMGTPDAFSKAINAVTSDENMTEWKGEKATGLLRPFKNCQ